MVTTPTLRSQNWRDPEVRGRPPGRSWDIVLKLLVIAVAAHSIVAGLLLLFFPLWTLRLTGWNYTGPVFWPSQAGLFLTLLGAVYASAIRWRAAVWFVIISKASAVVFLLLSVLCLGAPGVVVTMALGDGFMGLSVALVLWRHTRALAVGAEL